MKPVFCQIICGQWEQDDQNGQGVRLQNILFALSTEGKVYKFIGAGWKELPDSVITQ